MASILYARDGVRFSNADLRDEVTIVEAREMFPPERCKWVPVPARFDKINTTTSVSEVSDFRYVILWVHENEGLPAGYYVIDSLTPSVATKKIVERIFISEIGRERIVDVSVGSRLDSEGRPALKVTVEIPEGASRKIGGEEAINAARRLRALVEQWPRNGTPLIQYATKAELQRNAAA
jgi:hypothetical protein